MKARLAFASLAFARCVAVLDLDASPAGDGGGGAGNASTGASSTLTSSTGSIEATTSAGPDGASVTSSNTGTGGAGGGAACDDVAARFSGAQLIDIDNPNHNALDLDGKFAIGAWVRLDPQVATIQSYTGYVLSRLSDTAKKGYALLVRRSNDGAIYPELRFYTHGVLSTCTGQIAIPVDAWTHVAGLVWDGHVQGADAGVWVGGQPACVISAGDAKLDKFPATPVMGAALGATSGFFLGLLDDVFVSRSEAAPPPALNGGGCAAEVVFFAPFDGVSTQTFKPLCVGAGVVAMLGSSANEAADDPALDGCQ